MFIIILFQPLQVPLHSSTGSVCVYGVCLMLRFVFHFSVRVYDLVLLILSALFLIYLLLQVVPTVRKLHGSVLLFRILYFMVTMCRVWELDTYMRGRHYYSIYSCRHHFTSKSRCVSWCFKLQVETVETGETERD